ncbi:MAG: class I SAM-dependent rRNA methyltransferase [Spirochaetia bacterium]
MSSSNAPVRGESAPEILLKEGREGPVRRRHHPWIYSQAIAEADDSAPAGGLVAVRAADGSVIGWGQYSPESLIAVRMVSYTAEKPAEDWVEQRVRAAWNLRAALGLDTDSFRVVNAEGDFLPGLVIDLYGDTAVVCPHTRSVEAGLERIAECLRGIRSDLRVFIRRDEHFARVERLRVASGYVRGEGEGSTVIREGSVRLKVDFAHGQKTGYYLDQRANRTLISRCCGGRTVLNLFSYTGAVALRAAAAGALRVISVDSSRSALELGEASVGLNPGLRGGQFEWVPADVFSYLESPPECDVLVADPPPFARRRVEREGALKGYLSLYQQCLRILSPGGLAFLFSCSGAVDRPMFQQVVAEAALRSGRTVRLLRELHADVDHPFAPSHPEGEYLKGWMVHVE